MTALQKPLEHLKKHKGNVEDPPVTKLVPSLQAHRIWGYDSTILTVIAGSFLSKATIAVGLVRQRRIWTGQVHQCRQFSI